MGPACHPLCTIKLSFLELFLAAHIFSLAFFFRSPAASQTVIPLLLTGTRMSSSMYYKTFLELFLAPHIWSLTFFFRSPAASQTVIPLLLNGTCMSSSMYYKTFFSWIFFGTSYLVTYLFFSFPCRLSNGDTAAAKWDPHVILYVQSSFFS